MSEYELPIVLDGKTTDAKKKAFIASLDKMVTTLKGKVVNITDWGIKDLAYPIKKSETGYFIIFSLELPEEGAHALSQKLRLENDIIRYLLIKLKAKRKLEIKRKTKTKKKLKHGKKSK